MKAGIKLGLFDTVPMYQVVKPAGTWESEHRAKAEPASPWKGLA